MEMVERFQQAHLDQELGDQESPTQPLQPLPPPLVSPPSTKPPVSHPTPMCTSRQLSANSGLSPQLIRIQLHVNPGPAANQFNARTLAFAQPIPIRPAASANHQAANRVQEAEPAARPAERPRPAGQTTDSRQTAGQTVEPIVEQAQVLGAVACPALQGTQACQDDDA